MTDDIIEWSCIDVSLWLRENNFREYVNLLCETHKIDGSALLTLTEDDLRNPPIKIKVLGDIKRLFIAINRLQQKNQKGLQLLGLKQSFSQDSSPTRSYIKKDSTTSFECSSPEIANGNGINSFSDQFDSICNEPEPEKWKTFIGLIYFVTVTLITSVVMVIVHDRVPDMQKYPPLPDIFLDNVPLIPWAFYMCELTGVILCIVWVSILIFHKYRLILMRRMFSLTGSVFLLRCVTMLITSLSVPGIHLKCEARPYGDMWAKLEQAFVIWKGCGLSLKGVRTCGDYMFSGHTVTLTLLNFFITEYTPASWHYLQTFTWVLNLFGIFFILAGHEHYSIDVFIAFYITTRLFLYYHSLANNRALMQRDSQRVRIWFPLFSYFESKVDYIVPNEYEWPFSLSNDTKRNCRKRVRDLVTQAKMKLNNEIEDTKRN
ncbi:SAMD8 (predicted) [Pycnogonum litorale]